MKNSLYLLVVAFVGLIMINGCQKSQLAAVSKTKLASASLSTDTSKKLKLIVSQPITVKNKADTLVISGLATADTVHWSVTPPGYTNVLQKSNSRYVISFETEGTFLVKAVVNGHDTLSATIKVDSISASSQPYTYIPFKNDDQIQLIPSLYKSALADSVYIALTAQTVDTYPCTNSLIHASWGTDLNNNFSVSIMGIEQPNGGFCMMGPGTLAVNMAFLQKMQNPYMVNGTYPLAVTFNGTTYKGNIIVSANAINFDWNYTSGVVFTSKQISR
jgi:hypothetical protein